MLGVVWPMIDSFYVFIETLLDVQCCISFYMLGVFSIVRH